MTATTSYRSQKCWRRRPHFPFGELLTTAETEKWILWVRQWLMWRVCQFPGQAQQPSDSRYLLFIIIIIITSASLAVCRQRRLPSSLVRGQVSTMSDVVWMPHI